MSNDTIFDVLRKTGYANRDNAEFLDNLSRHFSIKKDGDKIIVTVKEVLVFNLADDTTSASPERIQDVKKILEIRSFDETK